MRDYIAEANKFMYDDDYIVEAKFKIDGKEYASKKAAEEVLKKRGIHGSELYKKLKHGQFGDPTHEIKVDTHFDMQHHADTYRASAEKHGLNIMTPDNTIDRNHKSVHLQGSKENLERFIKKHHDDGTGEPEELNRINAIKKPRQSDITKFSRKYFNDDGSPKKS